MARGSTVLVLKHVQSNVLKQIYWTMQGVQWVWRLARLRRPATGFPGARSHWGRAASHPARGTHSFLLLSSQPPCCSLVSGTEPLFCLAHHIYSFNAPNLSVLPMHVQGASRARTVITGLQRGHREFLVAVRREGQFVGEMAAFASAALRCASVRACGPVRAKIVPGELLRACVERVPEVGPPSQPTPASLTELLAARLVLHGAWDEEITPQHHGSFELTRHLGIHRSVHCASRAAHIAAVAPASRRVAGPPLHAWGVWWLKTRALSWAPCCPAQARQQLKEMVWMKSSENMVLEAMFRLSGLHDALEELLRAPALPAGPTR